MLLPYWLFYFRNLFYPVLPVCFFKYELFPKSSRCLSTVSCAHVFFFPPVISFNVILNIFLLGTIFLKNLLST